jgi:hypothetical protein
MMEHDFLLRMATELKAATLPMLSVNFTSLVRKSFCMFVFCSLKHFNNLSIALSNSLFMFVGKIRRIFKNKKKSYKSLS